MEFVFAEWKLAERNNRPAVGVSVRENRLLGHHPETREGPRPAPGSAGQGPPLSEEGLQLRQHGQD